jgi:hypothetical protein
MIEARLIELREAAERHDFELRWTEPTQQEPTALVALRRGRLVIKAESADGLDTALEYFERGLGQLRRFLTSDADGMKIGAT